MERSRWMLATTRGIFAEVEEVTLEVPRGVWNVVRSSRDPSSEDWRWPDEAADPLSVIALSAVLGSVMDFPVDLPFGRSSITEIG